MRAALPATALALALAMAPCAAADDDGARRAASSFGAALTGGHAEDLRPLLPTRGKVRLTLIRLGPEEGSFGAGQVEALFRDFLAEGKVQSFVIARFETDGASSALAHGRAAITDRDGRSARIGVHLALEPENGRWVLREVKESAE